MCWQCQLGVRYKWVRTGTSLGPLDANAGVELKGFKLFETLGRELDIGFLAKL